MTDEPPPGEHLTVDERTAKGRGARAAVPRSSHAVWEDVAGHG